MAGYDPLTLAGVVHQWASDRPDLAIVTIEGAGVRPDETRTYGQLWQNGQHLAAGLRRLGLTSGDKVATLLANHVEYIDLLVACSLLDVTLVPIDPRTRGEKLVYMITAAACVGVIAGDYALAELIPVRERISGLTWMVGLPTDEGKATTDELRASGVLPYSDVNEVDCRHDVFPGSNADAAFLLLYTSGTTGDPKSIVFTHRRFCEVSKNLVHLFGLRQDDRMYTGLSLSHANALVLTLGNALVNAIPCVLSCRFTKSRLWDITRKYGCTTFNLLGGMTTAIYAEPPKPSDADNPVRCVISAGMPAAVWNAFRERFGVEVLEFYAAAEGGFTVNPVGVGPIGSVGKPAPNLEHRIVDDDGIDVTRDENGDRIGEILFRGIDGSPFRVEYYGNPEASARKCAGGWLHMGDVLREDKDGWLYFMFRQGSGIRRNGDFVDPAFIEKAIAESADVDDVHVYGIPAASGAVGENDVVAAVVPKHPDHSQFDVQALYRMCRRKLEANLVPSYIQVLNEIPKTVSEKPQDRLLMEALERNAGAVHREVREVGRFG